MTSTAFAVPALAQETMDAGQMDHGQMDHSQMDHSQMDHSQMDHSQMEADAPAEAASDAAMLSGDGAARADVSPASDGASDADPLVNIPVEQRNAAIEGFTKAQGLQKSGDYAGAVAALTPHLDTIRAMAATGDAQSSGFLADALTTVAVSRAQTGDVADIGAMLQEAVPARRAVFAANPGDANARLALVNSLNSTGNVMLQTADKPTAEPYFKEAADVAQEGYAADPANAALGNGYLTAAIGMNNVTADPEWYAKVKQVAVALNTAGTLDPTLAPVVQPLIGG